MFCFVHIIITTITIITCAIQFGVCIALQASLGRRDSVIYDILEYNQKRLH